MRCNRLFFNLQLARLELGARGRLRQIKALRHWVRAKNKEGSMGTLEQRVCLLPLTFPTFFMFYCFRFVVGYWRTRCAKRATARAERKGCKQMNLAYVRGFFEVIQIYLCTPNDALEGVFEIIGSNRARQCLKVSQYLPSLFFFSRGRGLANSRYAKYVGCPFNYQFWKIKK